jgi:polyisoprenoid-binding protein YceI
MNEETIMAIEDIAYRPAHGAVPAGRYRLDPKLSTVRFTAKKLGVFTIRGTIGLASGEFMVSTPLERSTVHVVLAADTFTTPMAKRDEHVKGPKLLDVATYPNMEFASTEVVPLRGAWEVLGTLIVHGRSAPAVLSVTATAQQGGGLVHISATADVDRRQFASPRCGLLRRRTSPCRSRPSAPRCAEPQRAPRCSTATPRAARSSNRAS